MISEKNKFISRTEHTCAYFYNSFSTDTFHCIHRNVHSPSTSYLNHEVVFFFYFTNTPNNLKITFFNFFVRVCDYINILTAVIITPKQAIHR